MRVSSKRVLVLVLGALLVACGEDEPIDAPRVQGHGGEPDLQTSPLLSVDEVGISVRYEETQASVSLPVEVIGQAGGTAIASVKLTDLHGTVLFEGQTSVELTEGTSEISVPVEGAEVPGSQAEQVEQLVRYELISSGMVASGTRSLYYTMGKLGLRMWAPARVDAGTSTTVRLWVRDLLSGEVVEGAEVYFGPSH